MARDDPAQPGSPPADARWGEPRRRTITWFEVSEVRRRAQKLPGRELLQGMIDGSIPPPPISQVIASRLISVGEGEAVFRCVPDESFVNPLGLVHGGLLCTLLDSAMGVAVQSTQPAGVGYATIELKVSYLAPLPHDGGEVEARGRALKVGRRIAFAEAHAYGSGGQLLGHATSSLARVGGEPDGAGP